MTRRLFVLLFGGALGLTVFCALQPTPVPLPVNENLQHMAAFGALMVSGGAIWRTGRQRPALAAALLVLGALIEAIQALPLIHRDADLKDWLADVAGIALAWLGLHLLTFFRRMAIDVPRAGREQHLAGVGEKHVPAPSTN